MTLPGLQFVCWSLTSLCYSNGHIETITWPTKKWPHIKRDSLIGRCKAANFQSGSWPCRCCQLDGLNRAADHISEAHVSFWFNQFQIGWPLHKHVNQHAKSNRAEEAKSCFQVLFDPCSGATSNYNQTHKIIVWKKNVLLVMPCVNHILRGRRRSLWNVIHIQNCHNCGGSENKHQQFNEW